MFEEGNGEKCVVNMSARGRDETEEKFEERRAKFFGDVQKDRRNPVCDGVEDKNVHSENLLKERYKSFKMVRYANSRQ